MTDERTRELILVDDDITDSISMFLRNLRDELIAKHPKVGKDYIEEVIDLTLEEAAEWEWD